MRTEKIRSLIIYSASILILAVLITAFFFVRPKVKALDFVTDQASLVVGWQPQTFTMPDSGGADIIASNFTLLRDNLGVSINDVVWFYSQSGEETLVVVSDEKVSAENLTLIKQVMADQQSALNNKSYSLINIDDRVIIITTDVNLQSQHLQKFIQFTDWPAAGLKIAWQGALPEQLNNFLPANLTTKNLSTTAGQKTLIRFQQTNGDYRLSWQETSETSLRVGPPLFFPSDFDNYLLLDKDHLNVLLNANLPLVQQWRDWLERYLANNYNLTLTNVLEDLGDPTILITKGDRWFLQSSSEQLPLLGQYFSNYLQPKLSVSKLPDGSSYRELVRNAETGTTIMVGEQSVTYWGEVEENRVYSFAGEQYSALTNSLKLLESGFVLRNSPIPEALKQCLGEEQGAILSLIWLKNGVADKITDNLAIYLQQDGAKQYIFCQQSKQ